MKAISDVTALVYDTGGLFLSLAHRVARDFKRTLYYVPNDGPFPLPNLTMLGDGFSDIEREVDFWCVLPECDLIVFPDVGNASLQTHLVDLGYPVLGSRSGDQLELRRAWFRSKQKEWGLETLEHEIVHGLPALREFLADHPGWFVKVSKWRGLTETFQYHEGERGQTKLDQLAVKLGPLAAQFPFIVEAPIEAIVETGIDEYCIDGQYPEMAVQGVETKDRAYCCAVTPMKEMPQALRDVNEALGPFFKATKYRNFFSAEVRITEDKTAYLTDPTCRQASPAGECLLELIENLADVIWHGAHGELVEPVYGAKFAVQAMVDHPDDNEHWRVMEWPEGLKKWFKPTGCVGLESHRIAFPPFPWSCDSVGSLVALGNTIQEALDTLKERASALEEQGMTVRIPDLAETLEAIHDEEAAGVPFSDTKTPPPEEAVAPVTLGGDS